MPTRLVTLKPTTISLPTGYEHDQRAIEGKRKLAELMLQQGLANDPNMISPFQVLGHMAQAWAGKSMSKEADKADDALLGRETSDYATKLGSFTTDAQTMTPQQLIEKYRAEPMLADVLKPYNEAFGASLKRKDEQDSFDPNKMVMWNPTTKRYEINPVRASAAMAAQGLPLVDAHGTPYPQSMPAPGADMQQGQPQLPQAGAPGATPNPTADSGFDPSDLSFLSQQERQIMGAEIKRRKGLTGQAAAAIPTAGPGHPPPSGVTSNGKPYWIVNGQPFDNPDGR